MNTSVSCKCEYYWTYRLKEILLSQICSHQFRFAHISSHLHRCKYRLIVKNSIGKFLSGCNQNSKMVVFFGNNAEDYLNNIL